jgi:hypothetical protein
MKTKAELEAEINDLKVRVAELEGQVTAYQYAFSLVNKPEPVNPYQPFDTWPDLNPSWYKVTSAPFNFNTTTHD